MIGIYVSVPIACFRVPRAREYFETFPCPPPATVYGMLLSLVGEEDRSIHIGAEIAIAVLSEPSYSTVLRTVWRVKDKKVGLGKKENRRPDFQELLTDIQLAVWIRPGKEDNEDASLVNRIRKAFQDPSSISRFGGLSLGESTHLVNGISLLKSQLQRVRLLIATEEGDMSLPIWPDHVGSNTRWGQYQLVSQEEVNDLPETAWTTISPPA